MGLEATVGNKTIDEGGLVDSGSDALISLVDVTKSFRRRGAGNSHQSGKIQVVKGVSLSVQPGEILAIVGESGSGKSTLGKLMLRQELADTGEVLIKGQAIERFAQGNKKVFAKTVQAVFQHPKLALDPRIEVGKQVIEPLIIHDQGTRKNFHDETALHLEKVGLSMDHARRLPGELSGGQAQRAVIARALTLNPEVLVCDEPVSALDLGIQAEILNLFLDLRSERNIALVFISHDLKLVAGIADRVAVLKEGRIVESGNAKELLSNPQHAYTQRLLKAAGMREISHEI